MYAQEENNPGSHNLYISIWLTTHRKSREKEQQRKQYLHTKVSTCVHKSPHLGQRSWFPPFPEFPEPDFLLLPSLTDF